MSETLERPLMGVRDFGVTHDGYLCSPVLDKNVWKPDTVERATCQGVPMSVHYDREAHDAPGDNCKCVVPETEVGAIGELKTAYKSWWNGPLMFIKTAGGNELSIGPNHPVLTASGWVAAKSLRKGDRVVSRTDSGGTLSNVDIQKLPASIHKVYAALSEVSTDKRVHGLSSFDFHGDGRFMQGEVDVVRADGPLGSVGQSSLFEHIREAALFGVSNHSFQAGGPLSVVGVVGSRGVLPSRAYRDAHAVADAVSKSPVRDADFFGEGANRFSGLIPLNQRFKAGDVASLILSGTKLDASAPQSALDGIKINAPLPSKVDGRLSSDISLNQSGFIGQVNGLPTPANGNTLSAESVVKGALSNADLGGEFLPGLPSDVSFDEVIEVRDFHYSGHVYDLQTESGAYVANNVIIHNCGYYGYYCTEAHKQHGGVMPDIKPVGTVVSAWGDVVLHDVGFRAEYMQVEAIVMLDDVEEYHLATGSDLTPAELVQSWHQLAERYAVPLLAPSEADAFCRDNGEVLEAAPFVDQAEAFVQLQARLQNSFHKMIKDLKPVLERMDANIKALDDQKHKRPARNFQEAIEKKRNKPAFWRDFAGGDVHDGTHRPADTQNKSRAKARSARTQARA